MPTSTSDPDGPPAARAGERDAAARARRRDAAAGPRGVDPPEGPGPRPGAGRDAADLAARLKAQARAEGFAAVGLCAPDAIPEAGERLRAWLAEGRHGSMTWMETRAAWRASPAALWPEARAVVMLADAYPAGPDPLALLARRDRGAISVYARGRDYHDTVKKRLKRLARWLVAEGGGDAKVFVDTAPVMEKPLAQAAGLGWQGKHANLLSREFGNWAFLGAIFTTLPLPPDPPEVEHCGSCRACLDVCPTAAFPAPFQLDARRCISYLTIEAKGPIPRAMRPLIGNRIYGCDDCLAVCPWNKFAVAAHEIGHAHRPELTAPRLAELAALDEAGFREVFAGSPVKRIGRARFLRNVLTAIGNAGGGNSEGGNSGGGNSGGGDSAETALADTAAALLDDPAPLIRGAAVWALGRLDPARARAEAAARPPDPDAEVAAEWAALGAP